MFPSAASDLFLSRKVLPPFLGELGYEVRYFVALVEPWLRSGWKILSNRPALYPVGSTIERPELFKAINALISAFDAQPMHGKIRVDFSNRLPPEQRERARRQFEVELRRLILPLIDSVGRPVTPLDVALTAAWRGVDEHFFYGYAGLVPSYKPEAFTRGGVAPRHIGVQFRKMSQKDPFRDSDPAALHPLLVNLAREVGLPLLVYGEPNGCVFPADCLLARQYHGDDMMGLAGDLSCLSSCEVMFAPDSGWADLMCWLQVPTILQSLASEYTYFSLIPFSPTLRIFKAEVPLIDQYREVVSLEPGSIELQSAGQNKMSHLNRAFFDLAGTLGRDS
jgi:hypothetical protein